MKLRQLVAATAEISGIPEATVAEMARNLQKADLVQVGKRGRYGGPDMNQFDAAALALAIVAAGDGRPVAQAQQPALYMAHNQLHHGYLDPGPTEYGAMLSAEQIPEVLAVHPGHNFHELLAGLIRDPHRAIPKDVHVLGFDVEVSFPRAVGEISIAFTRVPSKENSDKLGPRERLTLIYAHPDTAQCSAVDAGVVSPTWKTDAYHVRRVLRDRFFYQMHSALFGQEG